MATEIRMPKMGLTMTTGTVAKWLKREGDTVNKGEEVLEIMTEKITNVVESPTDGVLLKVVAAEGAELPIGGLLGIVGAAGERVTADASIVRVDDGDGPTREEVGEDSVSAAGKVSGARIKITPVAAKLARTAGIDCKAIVGTGPGGRITKEDVQRYAAGGADRSPKEPSTVDPDRAVGPGAAREAEYDVVSYAGTRKTIGDNLLRSWSGTPRVTNHVSVDVSRLQEARRLMNDGEVGARKVSITDLLIKLVASTLQSHPELNVTFEGNTIRKYRDVNVGVAVALERGLVVPVIHRADKKTLPQISDETKELVRKARENTLRMEEMSNGTFTITNLGAYGSVDFFTPIINRPQTAILGVGRIVEQPVVVDGQIVVRPMMGLSLTYDHRLIDGAPAAKFMKTLMRTIDKTLAYIMT